MPSLIQIHQLSIYHDDKLILKQLDLEIADIGILAIMGPSGTGKSTLLRTLAKCNDQQPAYTIQGEILFKGQDLFELSHKSGHEPVVILPQKARLYTGTVRDNLLEGVTTAISRSTLQSYRYCQRILSPWNLWRIFKDKLDEKVMSLSMAQHKKLLLVRLLAKHPKCVLLDEPLRDIAMVEEADLIRLIKQIGQQHSVVMVTHNKQEARALCDRVCLISNQRIVETTECTQFFKQPKTPEGKAFLQSGSSWALHKDATLDIPLPLCSLPLPREFHWIQPHLLGGMQYPGLLNDDKQDLSALQELKVSILISLTETAYDADKLHAYQIQGIHFPIDDMDVPSLAKTKALCIQIETWQQQNHAVIVHCKAGLGRTGTMLACMLVYQLKTAIKAIETVRLINPYYIQNDKQLEFVCLFEDFLSLTKQ
jgi:atypical dual specificity phosphatase